MNDEQLIGETEHDLSGISYRRRETDRPQPLDYPTRETLEKFIENQTQSKPVASSFIRRIFRFGA